jgi:hypothetical protein
MKYEGTKLPNFDPRESVAALEVIDIEVGSGEEVKPGATITAHYTGALVKNGIIFQSSHDFGKAITFWAQPSDRWLDARGAWYESRWHASADYPRGSSLWRAQSLWQYSGQ